MPRKASFSNVSSVSPGGIFSRSAAALTGEWRKARSRQLMAITQGDRGRGQGRWSVFSSAGCLTGTFRKLPAFVQEVEEERVSESGLPVVAVAAGSPVVPRLQVGLQK